MRVPQAGGVATPVTEVDTARREAFHGLPQFLPDGKHFLYEISGPPEIAGTYIGSLDAAPKEQSKQRLVPGQYVATFADGYVFFMRESTLMGQPFEVDALKLTGEPTPMADSVARTGSTGVFSVSPSGVLAYRTSAGVSSYRQVWLDRQGKELGTVGQAVRDERPRL